MRSLLAIIAPLFFTACALQTYPPYQLHDGAPLDASSRSTVKVVRSFGGPVVYLTYVDGKYVLDYPSLKGYPKDTFEANRLEPQAVELQPGQHKFRANFSYTDLVNKVQTLTLLTVLGSSPVSYANFRKSAYLEFVTKSGKTYLIRYVWDESKGSKGVVFAVDECGNDGKGCVQVDIVQSEERDSLTPSIPTASDLMAR